MFRYFASCLKHSGIRYILINNNDSCTLKIFNLYDKSIIFCLPLPFLQIDGKELSSCKCRIK